MSGSDEIRPEGTPRASRRPLMLAGSGGDEISTSLWMVPYADLMSNMLILFLSLFAYSFANRTPEYEKAVAHMEKEMSSGKHGEKKTARLKEADLAVDIKEMLKGLSLDELGVRVSSRYVHLSLPSPILFRLGSDRLSPDGARLLAPLAALLKKVPNPVLVEGHTDDVPISGGRHRSNWELSAARSFSVIEFFASQGLQPERFLARGYGEFRPVASNETYEGRQRNRRIEIRLVRAIETSVPVESRTAPPAAQPADSIAAPTEAQPVLPPDIPREAHPIFQPRTLREAPPADTSETAPLPVTPEPKPAPAATEASSDAT